MGAECALCCTTAHLPPAPQSLARYRLRVVEPPQLPMEQKPNPDKDDPEFEPNLWMWVNPNVVFPPGKPGAPAPSEGEHPTSAHPAPQPPPGKDGSLVATVVDSLSPSPVPRELPEEAAPAGEPGGSSSVALLPPPQTAPRQPQSLQGAGSPEGRLWPRPPLNYFHLIALALRNSPPAGLNVQQIYSFTRQHFPFFRTAPEGWKNTIRHNLCFRDAFEKVPISAQGAAGAWPRSCLWKLTDEGRRRFEDEARGLASTQLDTIRRCMSQPEAMSLLFNL